MRQQPRGIWEERAAAPLQLPSHGGEMDGSAKQPSFFFFFTQGINNGLFSCPGPLEIQVC
jgi:hypothetical protein